MGCGSPREKIEDEMMVYKLERMEVQMEKEKELKKLAEIEGHTIERHFVPDYIDPKFAKEKRLYAEQNDIKDDDEEKTNKTRPKKKSSKKIIEKIKRKKSKNSIIVFLFYLKNEI